MPMTPLDLRNAIPHADIEAYVRRGRQLRAEAVRDVIGRMFRHSATARPAPLGLVFPHPADTTHVPLGCQRRPRDFGPLPASPLAGETGRNGAISLLL